MLELIFYSEMILCLFYMNRVSQMQKGYKLLNMSGNKFIKNLIFKNLYFGIYHFIVCLVLYLTFRIK